MDKIKQRIALAELEGWKEMPIGGLWKFKDTEMYAICDPSEIYCQQLPDYLNDRNALAKLLELDENNFPKIPFNLAEYIYELARILKISGENWFDTGEIYLIHTATPAQCCEALLRVIGKWED